MLALILYRVMSQRLKRCGTDQSPEAALADLQRILRHKSASTYLRPLRVLQP
jgi:hypothetical protein